MHQQKDARSKDFASFLFASKGLHICFSPVMFDENGNCLDNAIIKANNILEDTLIEKFDMDPIRADREQETKEMLAPAGKFVFAVDTIADRCENDSDYKTAISVKTEQGFDLLLRSKNYYDEETQTQFSPAIYELYNGTKLLQSEPMDFQTHLYKFGEMEHYLKEIGFTTVKTYSSFEKERAIDDQCDMFLFECSLG